MENDAKSILEMIDSSFLPDGKKEELRARFAREGASEKLIFDLQTALEHEIVKRGEMYEFVITDFERGCGEAENEYAQMRNALDVKLEADLEKISADDTSGKQEIFDTYYADVDKFQKQHETNMKSAFAKTSTALVQKMNNAD